MKVVRFIIAAISWTAIALTMIEAAAYIIKGHIGFAILATAAGIWIYVSYKGFMEEWK